MFRRSWGHIGSDGVWGRMESTQHVLKDTDITEMDTTDATVDTEETMSLTSLDIPVLPEMPEKWVVVINPLIFKCWLKYLEILGRAQGILMGP